MTDGSCVMIRKSRSEYSFIITPPRFCQAKNGLFCKKTIRLPKNAFGGARCGGMKKARLIRCLYIRVTVLMWDSRWRGSNPHGERRGRSSAWVFLCCDCAAQSCVSAFSISALPLNENFDSVPWIRRLMLLRCLKMTSPDMNAATNV